MKHIPHITLKSNLREPEFRIHGKKADIHFHDNFVWFPTGGNRRASGFYCDISSAGESVFLNRTPHMSIWYDYYGPHSVYAHNSPDDIQGVVHCADMTSPNPEDWSILPLKEYRDSRASLLSKEQ